MTLRLPDRNRPQLTPSDHFPAACRCQESSPDRSRCTRGTLCNHDLKDRMSPNYERSDTVHCFLGNILISKCKRGNFHTIHHSKRNNNMKEYLHNCNKRPWCVRQLPYNRDWLDLNVNIDGSAREHTKTHIHARLKQIELALFTLCDGSFVFCAEISAQVMVRRPITRSICRIGPVVGIGLPL